MTLNQAAWLVLSFDAVMIIYTLAIFVTSGISRRTAAVIGAVAAVWLVTLRLLFSNQLPFPEEISGISFFFVILAGVGLVGGILFGSRTVRHALGDVHPAALLAPQGIRVFFGATFLLWAGEGILPRTFGIIDGFTHIGAGFLGLAAAWGTARTSDAKSLPWMANLFGLADILIVATSIAFVLLRDIGPHHPMMYAVFAPAPVWLWLHVWSIYRLVADGEPARGRRDNRTAPSLQLPRPAAS